ncbi:hypothetical protein ES708_35206 [subsurface metagenome]
MNPAVIKEIFHILLTRFLSILIENNICAKAGITTIPINNADIIAKDFVKASGLKSLPSAACIANTGKKLTTVVANAVTTAEATSVAPL